jgi:hypothetical protein
MHALYTLTAGAPYHVSEAALVYISSVTVACCVSVVTVFSACCQCSAERCGEHVV